VTQQALDVRGDMLEDLLKQCLHLLTTGNVRNVFGELAHTMLERRNMHGLSVVNPWITEQKNFVLLQNWVHIVPIFLRLFSQIFF
jgi:hypothetical protein